MKTSKSVSVNKMKAYSAMAISFLAASNAVHAQVVYTDIDPDATFDADGQFFEVDLNADGNVDFKIAILSYSITSFFSSSGGSVFSGAVQGVFVFPYDGAAIIGYANSSLANPYVLSADEIIGSGPGFNDNVIQSLNNYQVVFDYPVSGSNYALLSYGYWGGAVDKFMGVKFQAGADTHYGYIRLDVSDNHHQFTIKDYAYNATPDEAIVAGDMGVEIHEILNDNQIVAYSNQNTIHLSIKDHLINNADITVFDLNGKAVYHCSTNSNECNITLNHVTTGYYLLQLITEEYSVYNKQLYIQN